MLPEAKGEGLTLLEKANRETRKHKQSTGKKEKPGLQFFLDFPKTLRQGAMTVKGETGTSEIDEKNI